MPKITVLLPVYNGEKYVKEAVESILAQTFSDFEFLIFDDGSTDNSLAIIKSFNDKRIRVIEHEKNKKLIATLNEGIDLARGEYIARMDADDISLPQRFEKQVAYMEKYPEIGACGTWAFKINSKGVRMGLFNCPCGERLAFGHWKTSPIIHPSAMIRVSQLGDFRYDADFVHAEDYELWLRMKTKCQLGNIPERLLLYRIHDNNISKKYRIEQLTSAYIAFQKYFPGDYSFDFFLALMLVRFAVSPVAMFKGYRKIFKNEKFSWKYALRDNFVYLLGWMFFQFKKDKWRLV